MFIRAVVKKNYCFFNLFDFFLQIHYIYLYRNNKYNF